LHHELLHYEENKRIAGSPAAGNRLHLTHNNKFMLINNAENNIDVYPVPTQKWFSKPDQKTYTVINIE